MINLKELIPSNIEKFRIDVGMSSTAPNMMENNFKRFYTSYTDVSYINVSLIDYIKEKKIVNDCIEFPNGNFNF